MSRPRTAQEFIHWMEVGEGARWLRLAAVLLLTLSVSITIAWRQFHGPTTELTLLQADVGRQLASGQGFTTHVNYPQVDAFLRSRGLRFDASRPYPEIYEAPFYSLVIGGALRILPASLRATLFGPAPPQPDGYGGDYFLLALNLVLFWLSLWLTFDLARRMFGAPAGWLALLGLLLSVSIWQQIVALNGTPLLMVLGLCAFHAWWRVESAESFQKAILPLLALGAFCGLLFLTEYSAGILVIVALAAARIPGRRLLPPLLVLASFLFVTGPWLVRNQLLTGSPVGLAVQNLALKAGDSTAEPSTVRSTLSAKLPSVNLDKLGNKALTSIQATLKSGIWSGGSLWFTAFFVAGCLYSFRSAPANRLRWIFVISFFVLVASQAGFNSGESERHAAIWTAPLLIVFGSGFFFVLLGSHPVFSGWPKASAAVLLLLQALPLAHDALEPRRIHFQYPPYYPQLLQGVRRELDLRGASESFGLMADIPAGIAWYSNSRAWAQPATLHDFYVVDTEQTVGILVLTAQTLNKPFFSELNAHPRAFGSLAGLVNPLGEWGEIYGGLLTGALPEQFPLRVPQRWSENLYVLFNPGLPPLLRNKGP